MPLNTVKIIELRERLKWTQQEAAERVGWVGANARQRWADLEAGRRADPRLSTLERVAAALGVQIADLITAEPKTRKKR